MNRLSAYSLRLVCLCPLVLLLLAAPVLAQTETPSPSPQATGTTTPTAPTLSPTLPATATPQATLTSAATTPTATKPPPGTPLPTNTAPPVVPLPAETTPAPLLDAATPPGAGGGLLGGDRLVPLLVGGLLLLAALAIVGLLLMRRRPARAVVPSGSTAPAAPAVTGRPTAALPPLGAETVTGVLSLVSLQLESDPAQVFPISGTPFAIGRDPSNQLVIDETFPQWQTVSREHAVISRGERGYVIEDLGSQNGVRVDGRLTPKNLLRNGARVSVGGVAFRFVDETQVN